NGERCREPVDEPLLLRGKGEHTGEPQCVDAAEVAMSRKSDKICGGAQSFPLKTFTSRPSASTIAVGKLCVMSPGSLADRVTNTPNREANVSMSFRSPVRNVQRPGSACRLSA